MIRDYKIPVVVAINKIDREAANLDNVMQDLAAHGIVPEQLGGDVACVGISAKLKKNIDLLEQKVVETAKKKINLIEDFSLNAQCFVIESNLDEKTHHVTATVVIKKGTMKVEDYFACGDHDGRVRFMLNDQGKQVKEAYPGMAVHIGGFKAFPEVGSPLYTSKDYHEVIRIAETYKQRKQKEKMLSIPKEDKVHDIKKKVGKLTSLERRKIHGGDNIIRFEKMGLIEKQDVEKFARKLGIKDFEVDKVNLADLTESP